MHLSRREFETLVRQAVESLPERFHAHMEGLAVEVHDAPTPRMVREFELEEPETLLGFYTGVPLTERSVEGFDWPEKILIFQRAIEEDCDTREQIVEEVRITVMHEVGHHFGMDEDDLEELGYE